MSNKDTHEIPKTGEEQKTKEAISEFMDALDKRLASLWMMRQSMRTLEDELRNLRLAIGFVNNNEDLPSVGTIIQKALKFKLHCVLDDIYRLIELERQNKIDIGGQPLIHFKEPNND